MMRGSSLGTWCRLLGACAAIVGSGGCNGSPPLTTSGSGGSGGATGGSGGHGAGAAGSGGTAGTNVTGPFGANVDLLMMIDNSSSMTEMQEKLYLQLPVFIQSLQSLPT